MALTIEQQRALALASARKRRSEESSLPIRGDLGTDVASQLVKGATFGFGDEAIAGAASLMSAFGRKSLDNLGQDYQSALDIERRAESKFEQDNPLLSLGLQAAGGLGTGLAGGATKAGSSFVSSIGSGNAAARAAKAITAGAALGSASGGIYGFGTGEGGPENRLKSAGEGALIGGLVGGAIPSAAAGAGALKRVVIPEISPSIQALAQRAQQFGIPLSLNQVSPTRARKTVQKISQELPFSGVKDFENIQINAYNRAVAKTIGQDADNLNPSVIQAFRKDNSEKFSNAFKGQKFNFVNMIKNDFDKIAEEAKGTIDSGLYSIVKDNVDRTWLQLKSGRISGEKLSSIRSELLSRMTRMRNSAAPYVGDIIEKLDEIASAQMPGDKLKILQQARSEYRNFKTLQPLLEKSTDGNINPTQLINRVASSRYINASKTPIGGDDLVDLARIGKEFMPQLGGSDTFQKTLFGGGLGALGLTAMANPYIAAAAALKAGTMLGANRIFQKGINQNQNIVNRVIGASGKKQVGRDIPTITIRPSDKNKP